MEVVKRLQKAQIEPNKINSVVEQLTKVKIIDDARFAKDWVRSRDRLSPRGKYLLKQELKERGITPAVIEQTLNLRESAEWSEEIGLPFSDSPIDRRLVETLVSKHLLKNNLTTEKEKHLLMNKLARRGFSANLIYELVCRADRN